MSLRKNFTETLAEIHSDVIRMGNRANEMVKQAVDATLTDDANLAAQVVHADNEVDEMERALIQKAVLTVMREAPVAHDLRFLVSTLGVVGEIEKSADKAVKLARRVPKLSGRFPTEMKVSFQNLGEESRRAFAGALRLFSDYSDELADQVIRADEEIDRAYSEARNAVVKMIQSDPSSADHLIRTMEAFHTLEHVADHAVAIAVRVKMINAH